jgi:predicted glutamine amidotransferase
MQFVKNRNQESTLVISHIRKATLGKPSIENKQPFNRELSSQIHTFVHNGMIPGIFKLHSLSKTGYNPIGETDSEYAFCLLMAQMAKLWQSAAQAPSLDARLSVVRTFADSIRPFGPSNFIYSDSDFIFCHGDQRSHTDDMRPLGLYSLCRSCNLNQCMHSGSLLQQKPNPRTLH